MISPVSLWIIKRALLGGSGGSQQPGKGGNSVMSGMNILGAPSMPEISNVTRGADAGRKSSTSVPSVPNTTEGAGRTGAGADAGAKTRDPASSPQNMSPTIAAQPGISNTMPPGPGP